MVTIQNTFRLPPEIYPEPLITTFKYDHMLDVDIWSSDFKHRLKEQIILEIMNYHGDCGSPIQFNFEIQYDSHIYVTPTSILIPYYLNNLTGYKDLQPETTRELALIITAILFSQSTLTGKFDIQNPENIHKPLIEKGITIAQTLHQQLKALHLEILESANRYTQLELQNKLNLVNKMR